MLTAELSRALDTIFGELVNGVPKGPCFVLNPGDRGMLASLDRLDAEAASATPTGSASIAAHVDHVRYGLSLLNRWAVEGGNPFDGADYTQSWKITRVDAGEWAAIRSGLRAEVEAWQRVLATPRDANDIELAGVVASVVHLAYHVGAIRQLNAVLRGPSAEESA
jgi:hypothetical protein